MVYKPHLNQWNPSIVNQTNLKRTGAPMVLTLIVSIVGGSTLVEPTRAKGILESPCPNWVDLNP